VSAGQVLYGIVCAAGIWSVICMAAGMLIDRRPVVGPNWRGIVWPPAYQAWRRRQVEAHPYLSDLYRERVYPGPACEACTAASELSIGVHSPHDGDALADIAALPCTCGRVWTPNSEALSRLHRSEWTDG
jgi:hypothetical protein